MIVESYAAGTPSWVDLMTSDQDAAISFYADLFDWEVEKSGEDMGNYGMAMKGDRAVAGIGPIPDGNNMPPSWTTYISVDDVDVVAAAVVEAGGQLLGPIMDVSGEQGSPGRMAIIADPTGGVFGLWEPNEHKGSGLANEPGSFTWNELLSRDPKASRDFLGKVFGYEWDTMEDAPGGMEYVMGRVGERQVFGTMAMPETVPAEVPTYWNTYFAVADTDESVARAAASGAQVLQPPMDSPFGRMAVLMDPQGASFSIIAVADQAGS